MNHFDSWLRENAIDPAEFAAGIRADQPRGGQRKAPYPPGPVRAREMLREAAEALSEAASEGAVTRDVAAAAAQAAKIADAAPYGTTFSAAPPAGSKNGTDTAEWVASALGYASVDDARTAFSAARRHG